MNKTGLDNQSLLKAGEGGPGSINTPHAHTFNIDDDCLREFFPVRSNNVFVFTFNRPHITFNCVVIKYLFHFHSLAPPPLEIT